MKKHSPFAIVDFFAKRNCTLATGVPDSVLSHLTDGFQGVFGDDGHKIMANEGNAAALAMGHFLAGGGPAVVYLQNSGLGNLINPLASLAHLNIYQVPMFLIIGWRGQPGKNDEPQHIKQGRSTTEMLDLLDIPYWQLETAVEDLSTLTVAWEKMVATGTPVALLVGKGSIGPFTDRKLIASKNSKRFITREKALGLITGLARPEDAVIATTGKTGRELFEIRQARNEPNDDFLTVGGMGHASSIALGVALVQKNRCVICLDGDGALLMHMGSMPIIGAQQPKNFIHVLLNNESHESVGGQPTVAGGIDFKSLSLACGYNSYFSVREEINLTNVWHQIMETDGPIFLEIFISQGARANLGRPTLTPIENKINFMNKIASI